MNTEKMTGKDFFRKLFSTYLWGNLWAIAIVVALLCIGVKYGIDFYTHHGEAIAVPDIVHKSFDDAEDMLDELGLEIVVTDTGYVKSLPPDCILEQTPGPGKRVKSGHIIYVTVNAASAPTLVIPDIIDNCSLREAQMKLMTMGFKLADPEYIPGEKDWVYGIKANGRSVVAGQRVPFDVPLVIVAGDGSLDPNDSILYETPEYEYERDEPRYRYEYEDEEEEVFEEVTESEAPSEPVKEAPAKESKPSAPAAKPTPKE